MKLKTSPYLIPLIFIFGICFTHIHQGTLVVDAVRYAHIAQIILDTGDWVNLYDYRMDSPYLNKPPLLFWLLAIQFKIFGFSTFIAKFTPIIFAAGGLLIIYKLFLDFWGEKEALVALFIFSINKLFFREVLDLNFEGIVFLGGVLCFASTVRLFSKGKPYSVNLFFLYYSLGLLLLFYSKPPYIGLVILPTVFALWRGGFLKKFLVNKLFFISLLAIISLTLPWYLFSDFESLKATGDNQVLEPFRRKNGFLISTGKWVFSYLTSYFPSSIIAIWLLIERRKIKNLLATKFDLKIFEFLIVWLLPIIPIICFAGVRPRYLFIPSLALFFLTSIFCAKFLELISLKSFKIFGLMASLSCVVLFLVLNVRVHRENELIAYLRENYKPEENYSFCIDSKNKEKNHEVARLTEMLIQLEFGERKKVFNSSELAGSDFKVLANKTCYQEYKTLNPSSVFEELSTDSIAIFHF